MQIDFSPAFDMINHQGILFKVCSVGIRGPVFFILIWILGVVSNQLSLLRANLGKFLEPQDEIAGRGC